MTMQSAAIATAIESHFSTTFTAAPVAFENVAFAPPANSPWIRISVRIVGAERALLTGNRLSGKEVLAVVFVQVFTPRGSGPGGARTLIDAVRMALEEAEIETTSGLRVSMGSGRAGSTKEDEKGPWFQTNVTFDASAIER